MKWCDADDRTQPLITAAKQVNKEGEKRCELPETALLFYMGRGMKHLLESRPGEWSEQEFPRFLNVCPVYTHSSGLFCMLDRGRAAPQAVDTLETLAELGVKRIITAGLCGAFADGVEPGDVILPVRAHVEEGTSLHYYEEIEYAEPSPRLLKLAQEQFPEGKTLPIVSTDAVYRQTYHKEALWRRKGCVGVDMETSALFSVGAYRGLEAVAILVVSDKHPMEGQKAEWTWHMPRETRERFAERCMELAMKA